ncbi:trehalase family protein [[Clostridium] sordellii ATCC 9714]|nr:trehalase family protein [[Clostridium] sordellii ATCC 9714] [Paeniclostridium sordellii ATCC 9714]
MDNAIRFDLEQSDEYKVKVNKSVDDNGTVIGYTINQESVDLNSYLYKEKLILSKIAKKLGKEKESKVYIEESIKIKNYINQYMYDDETGYYYDIRRSLEKRNY